MVILSVVVPFISRVPVGDTEYEIAVVPLISFVTGLNFIARIIDSQQPFGLFVISLAVRLGVSIDFN